MKHVAYAFALIGAFLLGTLVPTASTQPTGARYVRVDFMKVPPGKGPAYRDLERNLWKPVHQARKEKGLITSWAVYGLHFPGAAVEYNYATVTGFPSFQALEDPQYPQLFKEVEGREYTEIQEITQGTRTLIRTDLWVLLEQTD